MVLAQVGENHMNKGKQYEWMHASVSRRIHSENSREVTTGSWSNISKPEEQSKPLQVNGGFLCELTGNWRGTELASWSEFFKVGFLCWANISIELKMKQNKNFCR